MPVPVHLNRPPHSVRLHAWGRADTGWWGCVTWMQRVSVDAGSGGRGEDEVAVAAWVPAATLTRPAWAPVEEVPRIHLPAESRQWPAPPGWPAWYAGVWLDGEVPCPPGTRPVTGAAWRRPPRRGVRPETTTPPA